MRACRIAYTRRRVNITWKAAPLPAAFYVALESGDWQRALSLYQRHPFHAPPADTFDLLKMIMHATGIGVADVKGRFNEKVRLLATLQRKKPEEVEWAVFWEALNRGDGRTISAALTGASISSPSMQVAVAEACAVLLKGVGSAWHERLIDRMPFAAVTRTNLVRVALNEQRWDVALDIMRNVRLTRSDVVTVWPLMTQFQWQHVLAMISACAKNSVPYDVALPFILRGGCTLQALSEHLEQARVLGDVDVVAPLLAYAVETEDWPYVERAVEHLVDIGQITSSARQAFEHLCRLHGRRKVCQLLRERNVDLARITIAQLESLKL